MIVIGIRRKNQLGVEIVEFLVQFGEYNVPITMPYIHEAKKFDTRKEAEEVLKKMPNGYKVIELCQQVK